MIPKQFDPISEDCRSVTARWTVVGTRRGEPVKCLSQIFNSVSQCDKGLVCWGCNSRPSPSEHCIKVVKADLPFCIEIFQIRRTSFFWTIY